MTQDAHTIHDAAEAGSSRLQVDELRDVGLQHYISLPRIAAIGTQSSGASLEERGRELVQVEVYRIQRRVAHRFSTC